MRRALRPHVSGAVVLAAFGMLSSSPAGARIDLMQWIPAGTRLVFEVDPRTLASQPLARDVLGLDALLAGTPSRRGVSAAARHVTIAWVPVGGSARPVLFGSDEGGMGSAFARLRGRSLGSAGGTPLYADAGGSGAALALLDRTCIVEGPPQAVRAVLELRAGRARRLAEVADAASTSRLLARAVPGSALTLVYLSPEGGSDLYEILRDVDRTLQADIGPALDSYRTPLRLLGAARGLCVELRQEQDVLASTLHLAMPNRIAAQLASASLAAGRDLARLASEAAVRAHTMSEADARQLDAVLATLRANASGELLRVRVRLNEPASQLGAR